MELRTIQEGIEKGIKWFDENYEALAVAKAEYEYAKDYSKTHLALCELKEKEDGDTQTTISRKALASLSYQEFLVDMHKTRLEYLKRKCEYEAKQAKFEGYRSLNKNIS